MEVYYRFVREEEMKNIITIWNDNIGCIFPMDKKLLYQNINLDRNLLRKDIVGAFVEENLIGFIMFKQQARESGLVKCNMRRGNISVLIVDFKYRNEGIASNLLYKCENALRSRGVKYIEIGGDTFGFFSGIPVEFKDGYEFFREKGYKDNSTSMDLICDISKLDLNYLKNNKKLAINEEEKYIVKSLEDEDKEGLAQFFQRNFSERLLEEINIILNEDINKDDVIIIKDIEKDIIIGFNIIYYKKSNIIGPSIYWRKLLGANYGGGGPIEIDSVYMNKNLEVTLLFKSIEMLKKKEVQYMCIDCTSFYKFYDKFNFIPWKSYVSMVKEFK